MVLTQQKHSPNLAKSFFSPKNVFLVLTKKEKKKKTFFSQLNLRIKVSLIDCHMSVSRAARTLVSK
jgi:hypothetical protein